MLTYILGVLTPFVLVGGFFVVRGTVRFIRTFCEVCFPSSFKNRGA